MNLRIAIPLTIVGVALICGVSLWMGTARDQASSDQAPPAPETSAVAQVNPVAPAEPLSSARPAAAAVSATVSAATSQSAAEEIQGPAPAESNYAKTELPVEFNYKRSPSNPQMFAVSLFNKAEKAMTLDVMISNAISGKSEETQLNVGPLQSKDIGIDDNIQIEQGDRITLHNPSYNDLLAEIRPR